ncbi:MAG TPA: TonB-dependent receptor plug domain-containing protein, partial [Terricaulis sp.]|nr:TonB-dependent receptor plug domain-containing protein [Terricaulis sp.]
VGVAAAVHACRGVRLDDVSTPEGVFDAGQDLLGDASRIEVVQGPMSALYGSQALGGVVNVLPRRGGEGGFNPSFEAAAGS